ncbi:hypothetical protein CONPUDRAFT_68213, partial [Coniophora puteana RWD-64-598 SS2]
PNDTVNYTENQLDAVIIDDDRLYEHKTLRINYTTYDIRREQDSVNPRSSRADIMVLSQDTPGDTDSHPYWYARIMYIFHVNVHFDREDRSKRCQMDIVLVRWLRKDSSYPSGFEARRPHCVSFFPLGMSACWDFIDPSTIVRGVHLLPVFDADQIPSPSVPSSASRLHFGTSKTTPIDEYARYYIGV